MQIDAPSAAALSTPQTNEIQHHHHLSHDDQQAKTRSDQARQHRIRIKNRRKRYLDTHPEYFNSGLELADPLLYDRLVRRFQTPAEREAEGRAKGYSGVLEADLLRSEAKLAALHNPDGSSVVVRRGSNGEIQVLEDEGDELATMTKEEGLARWRDDMTQRFLRGEDRDFRYEEVDESDEWDDVAEEERTAQDRYFDDEDPAWVHSGPGTPAITGETGVQDF
ncbi:coiled-coil domain-containing protein-domain-containing protein [Phyllosticta citricarpa]|uniref:Coiled-coil domain-containing protein-domain-containing protein n=2 Tax=Phyllosticta TaxID=121621 RepID=A0ABR1LWU4_9PEZI